MNPYSKCETCPLREQFNPILPSGDISAVKYCVVGEAPGADEQLKGEPFVGKSGRVIRRALWMEGVNQHDVYFTNIVKCRPPGNKITPEMIFSCGVDLQAELCFLPQDTCIYAAGTTARDILVPKLSGQRYTEARGWHYNTYVGAHPAYVLYDVKQSYSFLMDIRRYVRGPIQHPVNPSIGMLNVSNYDQFLAVLDGLPNDTFVAIDAETDQIDHQRNYVLSISFSYAENRAAIITTKEIYEPLLFLANDETGITRDMVREDARQFLVDVFTRRHIRFVMHNAQFDLRFLIGQLCVDNARCDMDTLLAHYCLWEYGGTHGLKQLATEYLDMPDYEADVVKYLSHGRNSRYSEIPTKVLYKYNAIDTECTRRLAIEFERLLRKEDMWEKPFLFPLMAVVPMFVDAEIQGFMIDKAHLEKVDQGLQYEVDAMLKKMADLITTMAFDHYELVKGEASFWKGRKVADLPPEIQLRRKYVKALEGILDEFNPASSMQMSTIIYDLFVLPSTLSVRTISKGTKLKPRSTAKEAQDKLLDLFRTAMVSLIFSSPHRERVLEELGVRPDEDLQKWARQWDSLPKIMALDFDKYGLNERKPKFITREAYEFLTMLREYRSLTKLQSSYAKKFIAAMGTDGCVHPRYKLYGTVTGRISASDPPIQTIPRDDDAWGSMIASGFIVPEGYKIVYADFSQCELRIAADVTGDEFMRNVLNKPDADFHSEVARKIYGDNFTKEQRNWYCKRAVFGWLYGGDVFQIARDALRFPEEEARQFADNWNENFKGAVQWRVDVANDVLKSGIIVTTFGRKRHFPVITEDNKIEAIHAAQNTPIQGPASDVTIIAALTLHKKYMYTNDVRLLVTVHDSVLFCVKDFLVDVVAAELSQIMVATAKQYFPSVEHKADTKIGQSWGDL